MKEYHAILEQQGKRLAPKLLKKHGLTCKALAYAKDEPVLYLAKPEWTNRFDPDRESTIGIFCSVWITAASLKSHKFPYNIHAKKLAKLPGYTLKPKQFAEDFRATVADKIKDWPAVRTDYGPGTLLQGKDVCELESFASRVEDRINAFADIHHDIDKLLEAHKT